MQMTEFIRDWNSAVASCEKVVLGIIDGVIALMSVPVKIEISTNIFAGKFKPMALARRVVTASRGVKLTMTNASHK